MSIELGSVWDKDSVNQVFLTDTGDGLELSIYDGDKEAALTLSPRGVRNLRLALQRFEKATA